MEYAKDPKLWEEFLLGEGYELLGQLDCGSFSDVFAVSSVHTGRALAVKRILARRSVMADPRVAAEIACLSRLRMRGSCVIGLEAAVVREGVACLLLELAPLGDLERYAASHSPLPASLLTSCARQVTTALIHCHRLRLAHRDLHPANVLLLTPRCVRLGDLGLAVACRDSRGRPLLCDDYLGRQPYLAPEVLRHRPYDALPADLWSLGALSAFLLTGQHPLPARPCDHCQQRCGNPLSSSASDGENDHCCESTLLSSVSDGENDQSCDNSLSSSVSDAESILCFENSVLSSVSDGENNTPSGKPLSSFVSDCDNDRSCLSGLHDPNNPSLSVASNGVRSFNKTAVDAHPQTEADDLKTSLRSVKEFLPVPPRSKRYRASSCDSEGGCCSEANTEGLKTPQCPPSAASFAEDLQNSQHHISYSCIEDSNTVHMSESCTENMDFPKRHISGSDIEDMSLSQNHNFVSCKDVMRSPQRTSKGCTEDLDLPQHHSSPNNIVKDAHSISSNGGSKSPPSMLTSQAVDLAQQHFSSDDASESASSVLTSQAGEPSCECECHQGDPFFITCRRLEGEETNVVSSALMGMVSRLCVQDPSKRMSAEDVLQWWKQRMAKAGKT